MHPSVRVTATAAPAEQLAPIAVTVWTEDGSKVSRQARVTWRSVVELVGIGLEPADAALVAPMRLVSAGDGEPYIESVRPDDFSGSPLPDGDNSGGSAAWEAALATASELTVWAEVYWVDGKGNSFYLSIDRGPGSILGNQGALGGWIWVKGPTVQFGPGKHTLCVRAREEGARIRRLRLTSDPENTPGDTAPTQE